MRTFAAILFGDTVLALLALHRGRRRIPALLFVAAVATLGLAWMSGNLPASTGLDGPLPIALFVAMPGAALIATGAAWQVVRYRPSLPALEPPR